MNANEDQKPERKGREVFFGAEKASFVSLAQTFAPFAVCFSSGYSRSFADP